MNELSFIKHYYRPQRNFHRRVSFCSQGGHVWLPGGMCGCQRACMVAGGACVVAGGHAWLLGGLRGEGGMRGERGACVAKGGMHGEGGHA